MVEELSAIREQLFDAPSDVKQSFNNIVQYFGFFFKDKPVDTKGVYNKERITPEKARDRYQQKMRESGTDTKSYIDAMDHEFHKMSKKDRRKKFSALISQFKESEGSKSDTLGAKIMRLMMHIKLIKILKYMKVIKYKKTPVNKPIDKSLSSKVEELLSDDSLIVCSDELPTHRLRQIFRNFEVTPKGESMVMKRMNDEDFRNKFKPESTLILIPLNGRFHTTIEEALEGQVTEYKLITPDSPAKPAQENEMLLKDVPEGVKKSIEHFEFFSVGRTNGPSNQVIRDETYEGMRMRYDVNSRIELAKNGFILRYTFKPEKLENMAKLIKPDKTEIVVMQKNFNLWLLGLEVLTNDIHDAYRIFTKLIEKYA